MAATEKSVIPKGMTIEGDVTMDGVLELSGEVIGNIKAENLTVLGAVKGNLDVEKRVDIEKGAVVMGKIAAGEMNVNLGAICEIDMEKTYADQSAAQFFADYMSKHKPAAADDM